MEEVARSGNLSLLADFLAATEPPSEAAAAALKALVDTGHLEASEYIQKSGPPTVRRATSRGAQHRHSGCRTSSLPKTFTRRRAASGPFSLGLGHREIPSLDHLPDQPDEQRVRTWTFLRL